MAYENLCMYCFEDAGGQTVCPHCGRDSRTAVPQVQLLPGTIIYGGRFLVGRALGQDANGVVYTALDLKLQRKLRIREYFPRDCASRLSDGTVVPAAGAEDQFDSGLKRVKASVQNAENPANRHFFFEENGTGYIVQRKTAAAAAPVSRRDYDDDEDEDDEETDGPNVKAILGIAIAVIAIVAIVVFAIINMLGGAMDRTNGIQDVTKEEVWQPLELPTPTPYVAATIGAMVDHEGDDWMNESYNGNVDKEFEQQASTDRTPIPTIKPTPTPYAGLKADATISSKSSEEEIKDLQIVLAQQGWLDGTDITGKYDEATIAAVKAFQNFMNTHYQLNENLVVDGIAGKKTLSALLQYEYSKNPDSITPEPTVLPTLAPTNTPAPTAEPVIDGEADAQTVAKVQKMLIALDLLDPTGMDGIYGDATRNAVIAFQLRVNELFGETVLTPTGTVNKLTWDYLKLYTEQYGSTTPAPAVTATPTAVPATDAPVVTPEPTAVPSQPTEVPATQQPEEEVPEEDGSLNENSDKESIMALQSMLAKYGFLTSSQVDGIFGNQTHAAIANFQKYINAVRGAGTLEVTGNADSNTLDMLLQMEEFNTYTQVDANSSPESIAQLQKRLAELKWLNVDGPTGSYDDITRAAVRNFQEYINSQADAPFTLQVTGIADPLTLDYLALNNKNVVNPNPQAAVTAKPQATEEPEITAEPEATAVPEITAEPEVTAEPEITAEPEVTAEPEITAEPEVTAEPEIDETPEESGGIHENSDPDNITSLQNMLAEYGFMGRDEVDGAYGNVTSSAVANFQRFVNQMNGAGTLEVTGKADENTLDWLLRLQDELPYGLIDSESDAEAVEKVQQRLIALGWLPEGHVNGSYDEATRKATAAFQEFVNGKNPPIVVRVTGYADITTQQYLLLDSLANPNPVTEESANPNSEPTPVAAETVAPTQEITAEPTVVPTEAPVVTEEPTPVPTEEPTPVPTEEPTPVPTEEPTPVPTEEPTPMPTEEPTPVPTEEPTPVPTEEPTPVPTEEPTPVPTEEPTPVPTAEPQISAQSPADMVLPMQQRLVELGLMTEEQLTGTLDMVTLQAIAQFQAEFNTAMGSDVLTVINLEKPEKAVVDYYTLCALYGIEP